MATGQPQLGGLTGGSPGPQPLCIRVACESPDCGALLEVPVPEDVRVQAPPSLVIRCANCRRLLQVNLPPETYATYDAQIQAQQQASLIRQQQLQLAQLQALQAQLQAQQQALLAGLGLDSLGGLGGLGGLASTLGGSLGLPQVGSLPQLSPTQTSQAMQPQQFGQPQHQLPSLPAQPVQPAPQAPQAQEVAQLPIAPLATSAAGSGGGGGGGGGGISSLGGPSTLLAQLAHSTPASSLSPKAAAEAGGIHLTDIALLQGELFRGSGQQTSVGPGEGEAKEPGRKSKSRKRSESSEGQAKRPLTDYQAFMQEEYKRLREEHPEVHPRELFGRAAKAVSDEEGRDGSPGTGRERGGSGRGTQGQEEGERDKGASDEEEEQEEVPTGMLTTTTPTSEGMQRTTSPQTPLSTLLRDSLREEGEGGRRDLGLLSTLEGGIRREERGGVDEQGGVLSTPKKGALGALGTFSALGGGGEGRDGGEEGEGEGEGGGGGLAVRWPAAEPPTGEPRDGGGYFTGMLNYRVPREGEGKGGSTCIAQWQHSEKNSRRRLLNDEQLRALLAGKSPRRARRTSSSSTLGDMGTATATHTYGQDTVIRCGNSSAAIGSAQISLLDGGLNTPGTLDTPASELKQGPLSILDPSHQP